MAEKPDSSKGRRDFLRTLARGLAIGSLGLLGWAASRRRGTARRQETCTGDGVCRRCPSLEGCGLPQARSFKRAKEKNA